MIPPLFTLAQSFCSEFLVLNFLVQKNEKVLKDKLLGENFCFPACVTQAITSGALSMLVKAVAFYQPAPEQSEKHANMRTHQERAQSSREQREVDMILTLEFQTLLNIRHFSFREYLLLTMGNNWRRK